MMTLSPQLEKNLTEIYMTIREVPAWLSYCKGAEFTSEELDYLEKLDIELGSYQSEKEANKWAQEISRKGGPDIAFLDSDEEKIRVLLDRLFKKWLEIDVAILKGEGFKDLRWKREEMFADEERIKKLRRKQIYATNPDKRIDEEAIIRAREYPLDKLVAEKRIPCPFHQGKDKNFSIHGKYGRCFVCGEWCDSIKWLMNIEGYSFKEAVKALSGL